MCKSGQQGSKMLSSKYLLICCILLLSVYCYYLYLGEIDLIGVMAKMGHDSHESSNPAQNSHVAVAVVLCAPSGSADADAESIVKSAKKYLLQLKVLIKSLLLSEYEYRQYTSTPQSPQADGKDKLELVIFSDHKAISDEVKRILYDSGELNPAYVNLIRVTFAPVLYPKEFRYLKYLKSPCMTFRLFLAQALPNHDSVLYVDTDVIFMQNPRVVTSELAQFNESQWVGMSPDWFNNLPNQVPFYGLQGLNSGVDLYNLTRMRMSGFLEQVPIIYNQHKIKLEDSSDQGFLNVYFHARPEEVRQLPCEHDFLPLHCTKSPLCEGPLSGKGVAILHGCSGAFFKTKPENPFSITFQEYEELKMDYSSVLVDIKAFRQKLKGRLEYNTKLMRNPTGSSRIGGWAWFEMACIQNKYFLGNFFGNETQWALTQDTL